MNFKTTLILILILAGAAGALYFTREKPAADQTATPQPASLLTITAADVNRITVTPADSSAFTLQKTNGSWQLTDPVTAPAETFEVDSLIRAFTDAKTTGSVPAGTDQDATGLAHPRDVVQLVTADKIVKLNIGDRSPVGDNLYVQVVGQPEVQMVSATDVADRLTKGPDAYRKTNLVTAAADQIKQITIDNPGTATQPAQKIVLQKQGGSWQMVAPASMAADDSAVSDLTYALTGLRADSFADARTLPAAATARPQLTVSYSTDAPAPPPPATAPSTQPAFTTIAFDSYDDILKKNVYVSVGGGAASATSSVAKVAASVIDSFRKTPLDLRDKTVMNFDPAVVKAISLTSDLPAATQPTTRPASTTAILLQKRPPTAAALGPAMPTTASATTRPATTHPATTHPATAPVIALSKWIVASNHAAAADDSKVITLLTALHPLKADKFLPTAPPSTQPAGIYTLTITTTGPFGTNIVDHTLHLQDPGHDAPLEGSYNGVNFELPRTLLTELQGAWEKVRSP
jgi:hypothetical protein